MIIYFSIAVINFYNFFFENYPAPASPLRHRSALLLGHILELRVCGALWARILLRVRYDSIMHTKKKCRAPLQNGSFKDGKEKILQFLVSSKIKN